MCRIEHIFNSIFSLKAMKYTKLISIIGVSVLFAVCLQVYRIIQNYQFHKERVHIDLQNSLNYCTDLYFQEIGKKDILSVNFSSSDTSSTGEDSDFLQFQKIDSNHILKGNSNREESENDVINPVKIKEITISSSVNKTLKAIILRDTLDHQLFETLFKTELVPYNLNPKFEIIHFNDLMEAEKPDLFESYPSNQIIEASSPFIPKGQRIFLHYTNEPRTLLARGLFDISISLVFIGLIGYAFLVLFKSIKNQKEIEEGNQEFVNFISHNLKSPLSNSIFSVDLLKKQVDTQQIKTLDLHVLDILKRNLLNLNGICERILNISAISHKDKPLNKVSFDLLPVLKEIVFAEQSLTDKAILLEADIKEAIVSADLAYLKETLAIVIENAIRYGGDIIKVVVENKDGFTLSIMDNGDGIPTKFRKKIFEKYQRGTYQKNETVKGSGLGLYFAKSIIESHKGSLKLKFSEPWTIFQIRLPHM